MDLVLTLFFERTEPMPQCPRAPVRGGKRGIEDNSKIIFLISEKKNVCCDPSLEPSWQDGSNDGSQHMFYP